MTVVWAEPTLRGFVEHLRNHPPFPGDFALFSASLSKDLCSIQGCAWDEIGRREIVESALWAVWSRRWGPYLEGESKGYC